MADGFELLTRRGCHLCDDALVVLRAVGIEPALVDIDLDLGLLRAYDHRVPVLRDATTGTILAEGAITPETVRGLR